MTGNLPDDPFKGSVREIMLVCLPAEFDAQRACDHYDDLQSRLTHNHPPHIFTALATEQGTDLLIAFREAVKLKDVNDVIATVVQQEIYACGEDPDYWDYGGTAMNEGLFPALLDFYRNDYNGPR